MRFVWTRELGGVQSAIGHTGLELRKKPRLEIQIWKSLTYN